MAGSSSMAPSSLPSAAPIPPGSISEILLMFRAGKMHTTEASVFADPPKGMIYVARDEEKLVHFKWIDSCTNVVEDDLIINPKKAFFNKVREVSGRVYQLKFKTNSPSLYYFMQEQSDAHDETIRACVNFYLNQPSDLYLGGEQDDLDYFSSSANSLDFKIEEELQDEFRKISVDTNLLSKKTRFSDFCLRDIFNGDLTVPLDRKFNLRENLWPYIPPGLGLRPIDVLETIVSSLFQQEMDSFDEALRTGTLDSFQFEADPNKYKLTLLSVLAAIEDAVAELPENPTELDTKSLNSLKYEDEASSSGACS